LDLDEDSGGLRRERIGVEQIQFEDVGGWSQFRNKITFIPQLKGHVLTPKFGKESDLWVQLGEESSSGRKVSSDAFGRKIRVRLSASVRQGNS
jgi:hypothetical protein